MKFNTYIDISFDSVDIATRLKKININKSEGPMAAIQEFYLKMQKSQHIL